MALVENVHLNWFLEFLILTLLFTLFVYMGGKNFFAKDKEMKKLMRFTSVVAGAVAALGIKARVDGSILELMYESALFWPVMLLVVAAVLVRFIVAPIVKSFTGQITGKWNWFNVGFIALVIVGLFWFFWEEIVSGLFGAISFGKIGFFLLLSFGIWLWLKYKVFEGGKGLGYKSFVVFTILFAFFFFGYGGWWGLIILALIAVAVAFAFYWAKVKLTGVTGELKKAGKETYERTVWDTFLGGRREASSDFKVSEITDNISAAVASTRNTPDLSLASAPGGIFMRKMMRDLAAAKIVVDQVKKMSGLYAIVTKLARRVQAMGTRVSSAFAEANRAGRADEALQGRQIELLTQLNLRQRGAPPTLYENLQTLAAQIREVSFSNLEGLYKAYEAALTAYSKKPSAEGKNALESARKSLNAELKEVQENSDMIRATTNLERYTAMANNFEQDVEAFERACLGEVVPEEGEGAREGAPEPVAESGAVSAGKLTESLVDDVGTNIKEVSDLVAKVDSVLDDRTFLEGKA
ncbi:hypothetical protein COV18_06410 [Candidatus Woesearchaeota archaeon CG10_big_fil_rev_8_21_14_0_10_37_12]|nr:MAG: hypothetical protein COV18_06410 [Candidatus Woesearchaeota archaeon CG10_big_fil_rev_8_21_14_0_10_37_12]